MKGKIAKYYQEHKNDQVTFESLVEERRQWYEMQDNLRKQLNIAIDCLKLYADRRCWHDCYIEMSPDGPKEKRTQAFFAVCGFNSAEKALKMMNKEVLNNESA